MNGGALARLFPGPGVCFDLDGTLIDSNAAHARAYLQTLRELAPEHEKRFDYEAVKGWATKDVFRHLGLHDEGLVRHKQATYRKVLESGGVPFLPGAKELVRLLVAEGRRLALVTGSSRGSAEGAVRAGGLEDCFQVLVTGDDVSPGKPHPGGYLRACEALGIAGAVATAVEDAVAGVVAARGAGLRVIGVCNSIASAVDDGFASTQALYEAALAGTPGGRA